MKRGRTESAAAAHFVAVEKMIDDLKHTPAVSNKPRKIKQTTYYCKYCPANQKQVGDSGKFEFIAVMGATLRPQPPHFASPQPALSLSSPRACRLG